MSVKRCGNSAQFCFVASHDGDSGAVYEGGRWPLMDMNIVCRRLEVGYLCDV